MKIEIDKIPDGGLDLHAEEPAERYGIEKELAQFTSPVTIDVHADFLSSQLLVRGTIQAKTAGVCSRCLKEIANPVRIDEYTFDCDASPGDIIDLTENIREHIIIALPMKQVCAEQCKGLCPRCGRDLNISVCDCSRKTVDPRFGGLDKLKFE